MDTEVATGESTGMISKEKTIAPQNIMDESSTQTIGASKADTLAWDTSLTTDFVQYAENMDTEVATGESAATISKEKTLATQKIMDESSTQTIGASKTDTSLKTDCVQYEKSYSKFLINIVILGTIGSGKATLANHIAKEELFTPRHDLAGRELDIENLILVVMLSY